MGKMAPRSGTTYTGKPCKKHPELLGLRVSANGTCVQCSRDACRARGEKVRRESGIKPRKLYSPEQAKARIRERDAKRNAERRKCEHYAAAQVERKRLWREKNKDHHLAVSREYERRQRETNIQRRLSKNLRHRLRKAMLGETRGVSAVRDLGMSIPMFRKYIESRFQPDMSWENYGKWHLDHIQPLASFDLTDADQARAACHYSNIQPLWAEENQRKWCHPPDALYQKALGVVSDPH